MTGQLEEFQQEAERVQHASVAGDDQGPEVETAMPLEGHEDLDVQLQHIEPGDGREGCDCHVGRNAEGDCVTILAVPRRHRRLVSGVGESNHHVWPHGEASRPFGRVLILW